MTQSEIVAIVAREVAKHLVVSIRPRTLADAIADLLRVKAAARRRPAYIRSLRQYLAQFARGREQLPVSSLTVGDLDDWFNSRNEAPCTQASNVGRLSALFQFSVRRGWLANNPCRRLEPVAVEYRAPKILTPEEASNLMEAVRATFPRGLAWFALALFAGIRPEECDRLTWAAIDLTAEVVRIDAAAAKLRQRRIVHLMPAAIAWLQVAKETGADLPIPNVTRRRMQRDLRPTMGWEAWPQDILRHTAASYWLAAIQDAGRVAHELGNSAGILLRHYRELVSREDAERFWALRPVPAEA